jgi:hypothetical protein
VESEEISPLPDGRIDAFHEAGHVDVNFGGSPSFRFAHCLHVGDANWGAG